MWEYGKLIPMEPRSTTEPFHSPDYLYQVKWDGVRILAFIQDEKVRLQNRKLRSRTHIYPDFKNLGQHIEAHQAILDGEMVVLRQGKPSFSGILKRDLKTDPARIKLAVQRYPATYIAFDLLALNGVDLTSEPLEKRLELLRKVAKTHDFFQVIEDFTDGVALFQIIEKNKMEGIVAKERSSPYLPGKKPPYWLKIKTSQDLIAIVGGYTIKRRRLSSLLLGAYLEDQFHYIGNAASGLTSRDQQMLSQYLPELKQNDSSFHNPPKLYGVETIWTQPLLTVKVEFMEWTGQYQMRAPVIKGFTQDQPKSCVIE